MPLIGINIEISGQYTKSENLSLFSALHKKWSFSLKISSVNVTKSAVSCSFTFTEEILDGKLHFLCSAGVSLVDLKHVNACLGHCFSTIGISQNVGPIWHKCRRFSIDKCLFQWWLWTDIYPIDYCL